MAEGEELGGRKRGIWVAVNVARNQHIAVVGSLKVLDPKRPIREADINVEAKQRRYTASSGTSSAKLLPVALAGFVSSAPNCSDNAETSRVPKRLVFAESKPAGNPTPSSRIDRATARFSI